MIFVHSFYIVLEQGSFCALPSSSVSGFFPSTFPEVYGMRLSVFPYLITLSDILTIPYHPIF